MQREAKSLELERERESRCCDTIKEIAHTYSKNTQGQKKEGNQHQQLKWLPANDEEDNNNDENGNVSW
jgi:hypothetical protein